MNNNKPVIFSTWGWKYAPPMREQSITGIVTEVYENSFLMLGEPTDGYLVEEVYSVSLKVENKDSYTSVSVGDEVVVYTTARLQKATRCKSIPFMQLPYEARHRKEAAEHEMSLL